MIIYIILSTVLAFTVGFYAGQRDKKDLIQPPKSLSEEVETIRCKMKTAVISQEEAIRIKTKLEPMLKHVTAIKYSKEETNEKA